MPLHNLRTELLLEVGDHLFDGHLPDPDKVGDIASLARVNKRFSYVFGDYLYLQNIKVYGGHGLRTAVACGSELGFKKFLQYGANVELPYDDGLPALHVAAMSDHLPMINLSLEHGANPERRYRNGRTPLLIALASLNEDAAVTISQHINHLSTLMLDYRDWNPLHYACSYPMWEYALYFLRRGGDVDVKNTDGDTALLLALR